MQRGEQQIHRACATKRATPIGGVGARQQGRVE